MARRSPVRDAVRDLLARDPRAWLIEELVEEVRRGRRHANASSVFRAVVALERDGTAHRVDLGDGRQRFESRRDHHEHIRCERCGSVADVEGCLVDGAAAQVGRMTGFDVTGHRLVLLGICQECQRRRLEELQGQLAELNAERPRL
jgi:Fur family ferric uptake transcriptional regulator